MGDFQETYPAGKATITAGKARQELDLVADKKRGHTTMMMPAGKFKLSVEADFNGKIAASSDSKAKSVNCREIDSIVK